MERDYGAELDALREEISKISQLLKNIAPQTKPLKTEKSEFAGEFQKMPNMHPDPLLNELMDRVISVADEDGATGAITCVGVFSSGGRQSNWIRNELETDSLLALAESRTAERVLSGVGSGDRLRILVALLRKSRTVEELVEICSFGSTGQAYHHIRALQNADIVRTGEEQRGIYYVTPHRVEGIIMLLAGISALIDSEYSSGTFETE